MGLDRKTKEAIRMERFKDVYERFKLRSLTTREASELLGISERQFFRQRINFALSIFGCERWRIDLYAPYGDWPIPCGNDCDLMFSKWQTVCHCHAIVI